MEWSAAHAHPLVGNLNPNTLAGLTSSKCRSRARLSKTSLNQRCQPSAKASLSVAFIRSTTHTTIHTDPRPQTEGHKFVAFSSLYWAMLSWLGWPPAICRAISLMHTTCTTSSHATSNCLNVTLTVTLRANGSSVSCAHSAIAQVRVFCLLFCTVVRTNLNVLRRQRQQLSLPSTMHAHLGHIRVFMVTSAS